MNPACERCKFWKIIEAATPYNRAIGLCHRFPTGEEHYSSWWCGEFKPIPKPKTRRAR